MQNAMVRVMDPPAALEEKELQGDDGVIEILNMKDVAEEAERLAKAISRWIEKEAIEPSEIAVLVSRQQSLYCQELGEALRARNVPFREEDQSQDVAAEPVVRLITDFLLVASGSAEPEAYRRLLETVVYNEGLDDEQEYRARSRWDRFVAGAREGVTSKKIELGDRDSLAKLVAELIATVGRESVVSLSADYAHGNRLDQLVETTVVRIAELLKTAAGVPEALAAFSADRAVRIMSIHKSKGLEFDTVVVMGVEQQTFWGKITEERSAYFVAISRAKSRLVLTICERRDRPKGASRWDVQRTSHDEFVGYAKTYA